MTINQLPQSQTAAASPPKSERRALIVILVDSLIAVLAIVTCAPGAGLILREPIAKLKTKDFYGHLIEVPTYRESLRPGEAHTIIEIEGDTGFYDDTPAYNVPQGQYFVMGDNRDSSTDSRVGADQGGVGFVPLENLVGKVIAGF